MTLGEKIQLQRKTKGLSQEQLAAQMNVSRQAISKWERDDSLPDLDNIRQLSAQFGVSTDYLLKDELDGEPKALPQGKDNKTVVRILEIASTFFLILGILCAWGGWYDQQKAESIFGGMMIQLVGIAGYSIGRVLSKEGNKSFRWIWWCNLALLICMPGSIFINLVCGRILAPYPLGLLPIALLLFCYGVFGVILFFVYRKRQGK